jgi:hypothetical protein
VFPEQSGFHTQWRRLNGWTFEHIPIWMEFVFSAIICVMTIAISIVPMRMGSYLLGGVTALTLSIVAYPGLKKLPDPWNDCLSLAILCCWGFFYVRGRLHFAPVKPASQDSHNGNRQESLERFSNQA